MVFDDFNTPAELGEVVDAPLDGDSDAKEKQPGGLADLVLSA